MRKVTLLVMFSTACLGWAGGVGLLGVGPLGGALPGTGLWAAEPDLSGLDVSKPESDLPELAQSAPVQSAPVQSRSVPSDANQLNAEQLARQLSAATVTIRVTVPPDAGVTVCSGVSLGDGFLVTYSNHPGNAEYRLTLPDGAQAQADARVIDVYSGLTLLQLAAQPAVEGGAANREPIQVKSLTPWAELPAAGATILTAAAAGLEQPVVSRGILGGAERTLSGTGLPPLLQCDVRTTDTSSGAALIDERGRLVGIVAVTAREGRSGGWTYAVPASHVQRLLRAYAQKQAGDNRLVILRRQRPMLGLSMVAGEESGSVIVERLEAQGPAKKSGVLQSDEILEVDGLKVRSVYQVVALVMKKQPGDRMEFMIRRGERTEKIAVTLEGGSVVEPSEVVRNGGELAEQKITVRRSGDQYNIDRPVIRQLNQPAEGDDPLPSAPAPAANAAQLALIQEQVKRFAAYIEKLRVDVRDRDEELMQLRAELEMLRKQLESR